MADADSERPGVNKNDPASSEAFSSTIVTATGGPSFEDRRTGLIAFGILQLLMSGCVGLLVVFMMATGSRQPGGPRMMLPVIVIYVPIMIGLAALGVGSILARRWARALTLVLSWMWLIIGCFSLVMMLVSAPAFMRMLDAGGRMPAGARVGFLVGMASTMGCLYLILPGIFVTFYQSTNVKATCEYADPRVRWTDRCPLPVLGLSVMLAFGVVSFFSQFAYGGVMPFFGMIIKGALGIILMLVFSVLSAWLAWGTYRLKMSAWWMTLLMYVAFTLSAVITFSLIDMAEFYQAMNFPKEQLDEMITNPMIEKIPILVAGSGIGFVLYLLWVRRHFVAVQKSDD